MRISRSTVDKLGVKLYDKVSAAVAELIANSYDADAEKVTVRLPLSTLLRSDTEPTYVIEVEDDGHGMTPDEAIDEYLRVGRDRRADAAQGPKSRKKKRPVMGRKGIGKLAPFGICRTIEILSAGGTKTPQGYLVTHFQMDFNAIVQDTDEPVEFMAGPKDRTYERKAGTTIRLSGFLNRRVPDAETFHRQLAARFVFARPDFAILVVDTRDPEKNPPKEVDPLSVPVMDGTLIDLNSRPVVLENGNTLPVTGWLALAKDAYKYEETTGVRIYARNKIVATTRDFEQPAGFTGEFTMRSYLVGQVTAEWLDADDGDDLIRTDRQGIIWESDFGRALRTWGAELIKEIGAASRAPRRKRTSSIFMERSQIEKRAKARFKDKEIVSVAIELGRQIGGFAAEDELDDEVYVTDLSDVILSVAPHKALIEAFQDFGKKIGAGDSSLAALSDLFGKSRVAEMASYGQLAAERVKVIRELERIVLRKEDEDNFQELLAQSPWLIEATWSPITANQTLKTFKASFEAFWKERTGEDVVLAIGNETKRPDFTLANIGQRLHIVEIKASGHEFDNADWERLVNYVSAFEVFFSSNDSFSTEFPRGWRIDLVADGQKLTDPSYRIAFNSLVEKDQLVRVSWTDFLLKTKLAHQQFLEISDTVEEA